MKRDTKFLNLKAPVNKLLQNPMSTGPVSLHILMCLERIEKLLSEKKHLSVMVELGRVGKDRASLKKTSPDK